MKVLILFSYLTIYIVWGTTYYFIKVAVETIPPFYVVGLRFALGGILLLGFMALSRRFPSRTSPRQIGSSIFIGVLLLLGGNGLVTLAEKRVDSYLAALLVSCCPLFVVIYDRIFLGKPVSRVTVGSIVCGIIGIGVLLNDGTRVLPSIDIHSLFILLAVALWALGTSLSKKLPLPCDTMTNSMIQMGVVGVGTLCILQTLQPFTRIDWAGVTPFSWFSTIFLALFGTVALVAYGYLLKHQPNERVVTYVFVNPPLAIAVGLLAGKETPVPYLVPGVMLILAGLFMMFYGKTMMALLRRKG